MTVDTSPSALIDEVGRRCEKPSCAAVLTRREKETDHHFRKRRHCNTECARTNPLITSAQSAQWEQKRVAQNKECVVCGETFHRKRDESTKVFENRPTCGKPCAFEKKRSEAEEARKKDPKTCEVCSGEFYRRKGETKKVFGARETCGQACSQRARRARAGSQWSPKSPNGKRRALERVKLLPPATPLGREIPDAPPSPPRELWRPEIWKEQRDCRPKISA